MLGYISGVLEYYVTWYSVGLHGAECCVTLWMLDFVEGSGGLPGESPIKEWLFNTGWGCSFEKLWSMTKNENYNHPLCT